MADKLSKKLRAEIRVLQGLAWRRDLETALTGLEEQFELWRKQSIDAFELSDLIHKFHNGKNRDLWKFYSDHQNSFSVPSAIAREVILVSEVSKELLEIIDRDIQQFRQIYAEQDVFDDNQSN